MPRKFLIQNKFKIENIGLLIEETTKLYFLNTRNTNTIGMKVINIQPYDLDLHVFTSNRSLKMYCKKNSYLITKDEEDIDLSTCKGLSLVFPDHTLMVLLPKEYDEEVLDHELVHITWFVSHIIGQQLDYGNNEFQAYLFTDLKKKIKKKVYKL